MELGAIQVLNSEHSQKKSGKKNLNVLQQTWKQPEREYGG